MEIKRTSFFKNTAEDHQWLHNWVESLRQITRNDYLKMEVQTELGKTVIWGLNMDDQSKEALVIFPGFRTSVLFWDLDNGLDLVKDQFRVFMVETNGQPNLSDGNSPDIKGTGYGEWAAKVIQKLGLKEVIIAGASFGGLVCMKLCMVAPELVKKAFLLNPGCLQMISLSLTNLYYNLLPVFSPNEKNVKLFMDKVVFHKPNHSLSADAEKLLIDYAVFALTRYKDKTQKPYPMGKELTKVTTPVHLILGDKDMLFPTVKSERNARKLLPNLEAVTVFPNVGHGIETYREAIGVIEPV